MQAIQLKLSIQVRQILCIHFRTRSPTPLTNDLFIQTSLQRIRDVPPENREKLKSVSGPPCCQEEPLEIGMGRHSKMPIGSVGVPAESSEAEWPIRYLARGKRVVDSVAWCVRFP